MFASAADGPTAARGWGAMHQVRAELLAGYLDVAHDVGLDGMRLLREFGITDAALADPENRLPADSVIKLIERSADLSGNASFGLMMGERRTLSRLGPVSLLLERLPNVREVVRMGGAYRRHFGDVIEISFQEYGDTTVIQHELAPGFFSVQASDLINGAGHRTLTGVSAGRWKPLAVHTTHKAPADLTVWRRLYPCDIEFESSFNGFSCTTASMAEPLPLADPVMTQNARRLLALVPLAAGPELVSERVRRSIAVLLPSGRVTLRDVADHVAISARSLQRRLDEEGHNFGELLNDVRRELAAGYLSTSGQPVTSVAALLGYGSPSSFTRWFTAEFGATPRAWRAARLAVSSGNRVDDAT